MLDATHLVDPSVLALQEPFALLVAHEQLPTSAQADLKRDFPHYGSAGFSPYDATDCGPLVRELVNDHPD